jgi:hypothetical protein
LSEIKLNEVEVQRLNLQPKEVLVVKVKSDDISNQDLEALTNGLRGVFTNNKVVVLATGSDGAIDLTIAKETEYPEVNFCSDCACGKKAAYEGNENG